MHSNIELPTQLVSFLRGRVPLDYDAAQAEPGRISLVPLGHHRIGEIWIDATSNPDAAQDPNAGAAGYYVVPAVNLVASCDGYDPEYILMWLPDQRLFGTWDSDHGVALVFPGAGWQQIAADPIPYLNAQWEDESPVATPLTPGPDCAFRLGSPY